MKSKLRMNKLHTTLVGQPHLNFTYVRFKTKIQRMQTTWLYVTITELKYQSMVQHLVTIS